MLIFFLINFFSINLQAHELWLEAKNFNFNNQDTLEVDIKIGQGFKGTPFGYYEPLKKKLYLENKAILCIFISIDLFIIIQEMLKEDLENRGLLYQFTDEKVFELFEK